MGDAFSSKGFKQWHRANEAFSKHQKSLSHKDAVYRFSNLASEKSILSDLSISNTRTANPGNQVLDRNEIFASLRMLARQGLALRGEDEKDSNFAQVLNLRTRDNNELKEWLKRKTSWISHDIQNEMLERMANSVLRKIVSKIRDHKFFALLCDETSDNTGIEQLSVSIRTVNEALEPEEHFLGFYALSHFDADLHHGRSTTTQSVYQ